MDYRCPSYIWDSLDLLKQVFMSSTFYKMSINTNINSQAISWIYFCSLYLKTSPAGTSNKTFKRITDIDIDLYIYISLWIIIPVFLTFVMTTFSIYLIHN